jgi:hypothetical protein
LWEDPIHAEINSRGGSADCRGGHFRARAADGHPSIHRLHRRGQRHRRFLGGWRTSTITAAIHTPTGVAVDQAGNLFIGDHGNSCVRKVTPGGIITTVAGNGTAGFSGDGGPATSAQLNLLYRARPDSLGNLYIADSGNNRVRMVAPNGIITTIAGNGIAASTGDGGPATSASLNGPGDVVPDGAGNLYIAETFAERIRKVDAQGIITTVAGNGIAGYSGDGGPATQASLNNPNVLTLDPSGNLIVSDQANNRIRKVANGIISTVAGDGNSTYAGDGGLATKAGIDSPGGVAFDAAGNMYVADRNDYIRIVLTSGIIQTVAGDGSSADTGDSNDAATAAIGDPTTLAPSPSGGFYFADSSNERIRLLTPIQEAPAISGLVTASAFGAFSSAAPDHGSRFTAQTLLLARDPGPHPISTGRPRRPRSTAHQ